MKYYKTYKFAAVFFLIVASCFVAMLFFWPEPRHADATQMGSPVQQKAVVKQTDSDNRLYRVDFAKVDDISEGVYAAENDRESLFMQNPLGDSSPIQISPSNSGSSSELASAIDSDPESSTRIIQSASANTAASAAAANTSGTGSTSSVAAGSAGSSGTNAAGSSGAGTSGSSGTSGSDSSAANGSGSASTGSSGSSGGGGSSGGSGSSYTGNTGSPIVQQANYPVFVLPSYQRVLQDEWTVTGASSSEVFCAKNETESFQILVVNKSNDTLSDIEIVGSGWKSAGSSIVKEPVVTLYREHYVKVSKPSTGLKSKTGMYPDALIPFVNPYTNRPINNAKYLANHASVASQKTQGYWVDVTVGSEVAAGTYTYSFLVTSNGSPIAEIPVTLQVWNFTLPDSPVWTAWFFPLRQDLNIAYNVSVDSPEYEQILNRHYDLLYEHGIYPSFPKTPRIDYATGEVVFTADYVNKLRSFVNKYGTRVQFIPMEFSKKPQEFRTFVRAYNAFSVANPWAGQFVYYFDEPHTQDDYRLIKQCGDIIHAYAPSIKLSVTMDNMPKTSWPDINTVIDIYVQLFRLADKTNIASLQKPNREFWAYTALAREGPCWELDGSLMNYRIPAWCSYALGIEGILYWQTTVWAGNGPNQRPFDPWLTQESYQSSEGSCNGEGSLIYPGTQAGIDGPVASMRLKVFRDSVEDYAYLKLLESKIGKTQTTLQVSTIATDFLIYDKDPQSYVTKRQKIAELILN